MKRSPPWLRSPGAFAAGVALLGGVGCSVETVVRDDLGGADAATAVERSDAGETVEVPVGPEALGDGTLDSVRLVKVANGVRGWRATALAFNPIRSGELWVTLRLPPSGQECTSLVPVGCDALAGGVAIIHDATGAKPDVEGAQDGNAWHFMRRPSSIAFGAFEDGGLFSTCGESLTANYEDSELKFTGPVLWSSDPKVFGVEPKPGQNGTHIDMLHETPYCMGIAHERKNVYWAFNGDVGAVDRYDFHEPHAIGGEDHSDGEVFRYALGEFLRVPETPSHLAFDADTGLLYVADTGHHRIALVDPSTARRGGDIETTEPLVASGAMVGAKVTDFVPAGTLKAPSGLALRSKLLFVTDSATSTVHVFDLLGNRLRSLDTGLPVGALGGIAVGPDARVYLSNLLDSSVVRVEPND